GRAQAANSRPAYIGTRTYYAGSIRSASRMPSDFACPIALICAPSAGICAQLSGSLTTAIFDAVLGAPAAGSCGTRSSTRGPSTCATVPVTSETSTGLTPVVSFGNTVGCAGRPLAVVGPKAASGVVPHRSTDAAGPAPGASF